MWVVTRFGGAGLPQGAVGAAQLPWQTPPDQPSGCWTPRPAATHNCPISVSPSHPPILQRRLRSLGSEAGGEAAAAKVTLGGEKRAAREEAITLPLNGTHQGQSCGRRSERQPTRADALRPVHVPALPTTCSANWLTFHRRPGAAQPGGAVPRLSQPDAHHQRGRHPIRPLAAGGPSGVSVR